MMGRDEWPALPPSHAAFLKQALEVIPGTPGVDGLAAGGSFIIDEVDALSDLDLVVAVDPASWPEILDRRMLIARSLGPLLAGFTGEHVGEPRLLICLYGPPLLHIDLKFISLDDLHERVEDPVILWDREGKLKSALARAGAMYPPADRAWIEDRFWIWAHYLADKIERGELFQALDTLAFLRARVLGPLALERVGAPPDGVRRIELRARESAARLRKTVATHDAASCVRALEAAIDLYLELRETGDRTGGVKGNRTRGGEVDGSAIEREVRAYVAGLGARLGLDPA